MSWPSSFPPSVCAPCQEPLIAAYFVAPFELYLAQPDDDFQTRNPVGYRQVAEKFEYNLVADNGTHGLFWASIPAYLSEDLKSLGVIHFNVPFGTVVSELARAGLATDLKPSYRPKGDV